MHTTILLLLMRLKMMQQPGTVIIDVRSKALFESKDASAGNNIGRIKKNSINMPADGFAASFKALNCSKAAKHFYCTTNMAQKARIVAAGLAKQGYTRVYSLFEGISAFMCDNHLTQAQINDCLATPPVFHVTRRTGMY